MKVLIKYNRAVDKPAYKIKLKFMNTFEWHYASLIARHINDIFPEENILAYFNRHADEFNEQCYYSISPSSYYYLLQILWHDGICKYDPSIHDYFGTQQLHDALAELHK